MGWFVDDAGRKEAENAIRVRLDRYVAQDQLHQQFFLLDVSLL